MKVKVKEKMKALTDAVASIEKQFGQGAVMMLGSAPSGDKIPSFTSGSFGLDRALGVGGYPRGRLIEIYGPESSGKTTLALHAIAEVQKQGGACAFVDAEHALDVTYARKLGVDADRLLVSQPDCGEQALEITDTLIQSGGISLVVIDSVAALTPKAELDGEMGDHHVGLQARMMSKAMRKLTAVTHRTESTIIFINQIRMKIGVSFGSPETTTGGNALKFFASVRVDVRRIGKVKDAKETVANRTRARVVKNKMAPPFREAEFEIRFGHGINRIAEVFDIAVEEDVIEKSGSYYALDGERMAHGRDNALDHLKAHPDVTDMLAGRILDSKDKAGKAVPSQKEKDEKAA
ncbi:MAG: recombinase RecA [Proteobacteria bacterium]|nr:recombinase RecA [Pseudomonadota bacterium]